MADEDLSTPYSLLNAYQNLGMVGYIDSPRDRGMFSESQPKSVYSEPNTSGSGANQRALLWPYAQSLDKLSYTERQTEPDCFVAGTRVRMGDGTERNIGEVVAGDIVASPFGGTRKVLRSFERMHVGELCELRAEGCVDSVTATADHRFVSHVNASEWVWSEAGRLAEGDRVFLPKGDVSSKDMHVFDLAEEYECGDNLNDFAVGLKAPARRIVADDGKVRALGGRIQCNRHITLNEDVSWLIGLWLAEGSTDKNKSGVPYGLTWNLCKDELAIAQRVRHVLRQQFSVNATIYTSRTKPSCIFVGVNCAPIARWMYRICGSGNTYSKRVPPEVFRSPGDVRLWCLRGWIEGDGWVATGMRSGGSPYAMTKVSGTSVCRGLVRDMRYIAVSCGVRCSDTARKAHKRSKAASELHFYGDSAVAICPSRASLPSRVGGRKSTVWDVENGFAARIKSHKRREFVGPVYCIEVECDQAFIANGYAVHNCVSHASRNARDTSRSVQICITRKAEAFVARGATEPTYGARGHSGGGMAPAKAAMFEHDTGFLIRKKYDAVDLSVYKGAIGAGWGRSGVPDAVKELCREHKVGVIRQIRSIADARDALFNGYALMSGQYAAWDVSPNKDNYHSRISPGWKHAMSTVGMDFTKKHWPFNVFFIQNSWGEWNQKPKEWPKDYPPWVPGMIVTKEDDWAVCIESEDCYAYGSVDGFPPQKLPDYGAIGLLANE